MGRRALKHTKDFCDIKMRKNPTRYFARGDKYMVRYTTGAYYPSTSIIGLRATPNYCEDYPDHEDMILNTILHEINHWATFLLLTRYEWGRMYKGRRGIKHDEQLVERIANYPLERRT